MTSGSRFQRFTAELRRRHVPQTAAVYSVGSTVEREFPVIVLPRGS